ncbi:unnamed protein product [Polarella glacialis]|uniref:Uncharacterized protein n=1 Tax=Polarella glacialis TaxID=89957 RepID=A0A813KLJ4_POLGL|nr:unnamed protein product [Polarella glacialis]
MWWDACGGDDLRLRICEHLWPQEWAGRCGYLCRAARDFSTRRDVRVSLLGLLPQDAFALTSPLWRLLKRGIAAEAVGFLEAAFTAMSPRQPLRAQGCNTNCGSPTRLLGRCFTLAAQQGALDLVVLALRCLIDVERRINGQSALDSAAQGGHLGIVNALLAARAAPAQTAPARWTPLMRAALGGHKEVCACLLDAGAPLDEYADRSTALDVADANDHGQVAAQLLELAGRRYLELRPVERTGGVASGSARGTRLGVGPWRTTVPPVATATVARRLRLEEEEAEEEAAVARRRRGRRGRGNRGN